MKVRPTTEQRTHHTPLGTLPPAWDIVRLKTVSTESTDRNMALTYGRPDVLGVDNEAGLLPSTRKLGDDFRRYKLVRKDQFAYNPMRLNVRSIGLWRQDRTQIVSPDYIVFGCDERRLDPEFLDLVMDTEGWDRQIQQSGQGSIRIRYYFRHIGEFFIPLPSLPEQLAIARALRAVQQAKEARRREAALERERKAALMEHLFTHGTRGEATKQTEIGEMPESWAFAFLEKITQAMQYGLSVRGGEQGQYPILRMNNLVEGFATFIDLQYVDLDGKTLQQFKLNRGDVLFNRTNSFELVGRTGLFDLPGEYVFASYLIRLIPDQDLLSPAFLSRYFNWRRTQDRLKGLASRAVSQSNISAGKLKSFVIAVPPLGDQQIITALLDKCDATIAAVDKEEKLFDELFRTLLEELMTGRLSAVPLIETAENA